jgi:hypothetical protein
MTLQFERKYSTQGSGAPCHVSFCFFSGFFAGFFDFKTTRALLKTFKGSTRGCLGLLEMTSGLLKHQLEYIPASGCFIYS